VIWQQQQQQLWRQLQLTPTGSQLASVLHAVPGSSCWRQFATAAAAVGGRGGRSSSRPNASSVFGCLFLSWVCLWAVVCCRVNVLGCFCRVGDRVPGDRGEGPFAGCYLPRGRDEFVVFSAHQAVFAGGGEEACNILMSLWQGGLRQPACMHAFESIRYRSLHYYCVAPLLCYNLPSTQGSARPVNHRETARK
jgi:hypothetical protein